MDCISSEESFGCLVKALGDDIGRFLNVFGNPFITLGFFICGGLIFIFLARMLQGMIEF